MAVVKSSVDHSRDLITMPATTNVSIRHSDGKEDSLSTTALTAPTDAAPEVLFTIIEGFVKARSRITI
jgi:hypothetical protein